MVSKSTASTGGAAKSQKVTTQSRLTNIREHRETRKTPGVVAHQSPN